jgi:Zn-dependent peptidase ImmA (M78 family)
MYYSFREEVMMMKNLTLGERLKKIRNSLGLKLTEAADRLGFSNYQILSNIEEGKREVKAAELFNFSKVYYCSLDQLLGHSEPTLEVRFVWRNPPKERKVEIEKKIRFHCEKYKLLENFLNVKPKESFFYNANLDEISTYNNVNKLASKVSDILKLGRRPAFTLQKVLEQDYGVKILFLTTEGSSISTVSSDLGRIIVINKDEAPWRQNYDLAHELFHLITWEAVISSQNYVNEKYSNDIENKANSFASELLLPFEEVRNEIVDRREAFKQITYSDLVDIAIDFGISTQALVYRLFNLKFISDFELTKKLATDIDLLQINSEKRIEEWEKRESERFISLAIRCLRKGFISRGKFAELIELDDRSRIDEFIAGRGLIEKKGDLIEIMAP